MPKVSVIIPLYNASPYLAELKQVWEQTLNDFELILVDDCSQDDTWEQLQRFKSDYPERTIILARNERNLGPGGTRNHGLSLSSGQYVIFLDGDDRYEPTMLGKMAAKLDETCADVVCGGFMEHDQDRTELRLFSPRLIEQLGIYNSKGGGSALTELSPFTIEQVLIHPSLFPAPWNKMIRRSFLSEHNITFPSMSFGEDRCWSEHMVLKAHAIEVINEVLYHYQLRPGSISKAQNERFVAAFFAQLDYAYQLLQAANILERINTAWQFHYWDTLFSQFNRINQQPEVQLKLLQAACAFCQEHKMADSSDSMPLAARLGLYRLLPQVAALLPLRSKLKQQHRIYRHLKRFNRLLRVSD